MKLVIRSVIDGGSGRSLEQQIAALFSQGEQGAWYDIAPQYCFQDTAGTTPAAIGDPVGRLTDRSGRNNHALQTTATSRPILRQNAVTGAYYLEFDGSDDFLVTGSINFTATDKMTVWAGVRKLSDAAAGMVIEFGPNTSTTPRTFYLIAPSSGTAQNYGFAVRGGSVASINTTNGSYPAPNSAVLCGSSDFAQGLTLLRVNGGPTVAPTLVQAATYDDHPLYIGRRAGTSLPFNGHLYGLIVRGAASNDPQIKLVERYLAQKTGVTLA